MAGSYTVVIIPLHSNLHSLDALRFFLWLKRLKDLEQEKDCLWAGLQVLEQARLWYEGRLRENRERQCFAGDGTWGEAFPPACCGHRSGQRSCQKHRTPWMHGSLPSFNDNPSRSCLLRSCVQRVNGSLGNLMCDPKVAAGPCPEERADSISNLRWQNTLLIQEVSDKSREISRLEEERDSLLQQLGELQAS
ncbi:suppressor APC domain-containing protein 1 isoform X2 [Anguilla anguilla]|uniref:suppressor APC domain-containing protein 1 isoform X2 n=1 Tax=Anguilla anguilla TaxID=7936 RepID=UPI0015A8F9E8|nr:suppressor APC domain-containing protein 1 isoform X2 [Anguilla anguilla]